MKFIVMAACAALLFGCAAPQSIRAQYAPSDTYVDLRPYVSPVNVAVYQSPQALLKKVADLGGPQGKMETNSEFNARMSALGGSVIFSEINDAEIRFNQETGALSYASDMPDAQTFGFMEKGRGTADPGKLYVAIRLKGDWQDKGEFVGQNAFGATAAMREVEGRRVFLVSPPMPGPRLGVVEVSLVTDLKMSAAEFKAQRENLRLAVIYESVPNYLQYRKVVAQATIRNRQETTANNYFFSVKLAAAGIVNIKTGQIYADKTRVRFNAF
ncbi:hypothetical protein [Pseudomonas sp. CAM1A]|uniref:hypothetical protein n=1 Tax=Pseudomonas sp. CAM1A TaxID=3231717 RepID=UPI0039C5D7EF